MYVDCEWVEASPLSLCLPACENIEQDVVVHSKFRVCTCSTVIIQDYLIPGEDGFYYKIRDYNLNETDLLGSGGFGSCLWAQDLTTEKMFAIKQNKNESFKSIEDECHILSRLSDNDYIIKFLGAVVDEGELPTQPPLVCKMMMELAESKNMAIKV